MILLKKAGQCHASQWKISWFVPKSVIAKGLKAKMQM
jgi:hypothetical protein